MTFSPSSYVETILIKLLTLIAYDMYFNLYVSHWIICL
ncbi:hypothetical protein Pint_20569 [Pistacia integerrima]|uniref:Uncharacterized protein n=1 Tax=Pistacia integerrima TaxID=434235 RepID=A0ACC0XCW2_9ROSI|nr:hypothetical protein Pint_20569 [Pistacia integerrima]